MKKCASAILVLVSSSCVSVGIAGSYDALVAASTSMRKCIK